jgi:hypothetical protein
VTEIEQVGVNGVESVGCVILIEEGGSEVENDDPESFVGGKPEEGLSLIENEGVSRVERNDLGQGPDSFVVEVGVVEEGMGRRQLSVVVDSVDAGAVGGVDDWKWVDGWRGLMQKKVSEYACAWALELGPNPGEARSDVLDFGTTAAAAVGNDTRDQEARSV